MCGPTQDLRDTFFNGRNESEIYARICFRCHRSGDTATIHYADCGIIQEIYTLKVDLTDIFSLPPQQQIWYLRGRELEDNKSLFTYGITGMESNYSSNIIIDVKMRL
nr:hypothetical protein BgiMline_031103 [Biomphalaria glabrata]